MRLIIIKTSLIVHMFISVRNVKKKLLMVGFYLCCLIGSAGGGSSAPEVEPDAIWKLWS